MVLSGLVLAMPVAEARRADDERLLKIQNATHVPTVIGEQPLDLTLDFVVTAELGCSRAYHGIEDACVGEAGLAPGQGIEYEPSRYVPGATPFTIWYRSVPPVGEPAPWQQCPETHGKGQHLYISQRFSYDTGAPPVLDCLLQPPQPLTERPPPPRSDEPFRNRR